jgi:hypothetical protein
MQRREESGASEVCTHMVRYKHQFAYPSLRKLEGLSQSLNHSLNNMHLLGSYAMLIMPKP